MADPKPIDLDAGPYVFNFDQPGTLEEGSLNSPHLLVNSGGRLIIENGRGRTMRGEAPPTDRWNVAYRAQPNADYGKRPQNLWRVYTRSQFAGPVEASMSMRMTAYHSAPHYTDQDASDGLLLFMRMSPDGYEGYYAGIRVDGKVNVKKKLAVAAGGRPWTYYVLPNGTRSGFLPGTYSQGGNLIPLNRDFNIKCSAADEGDNVRLRLWVDGTLLVDCLDTPALGGRVVRSGHYGWRSDFAEVDCDDFRLARPAVPMTDFQRGRASMKAEVLAAVNAIAV